MKVTLPAPLVALCGWPKSGKSEIAKILHENLGAQVVDDGRVLRDACKALYGLSESDVSTQEGKAATRQVCGRNFQHRQLLGDLGNLLERYYGEQIIPELTLARLRQEDPYLLNAPLYVFPSVRKTQGITYKAAGGIVVEVRRPGCGDSGNDFDRWDASLVDMVIDNDGSLEDLQLQVVTVANRLCRSILEFEPA